MATVAARYAMFPETPVTAPHMNPIGWNPLENIWSSHNRDTKRGRHTVPLQQDQHGNLLGLQTVHFREAFVHSDTIGKLPKEIGIAAAASPSISGQGYHASSLSYQVGGGPGSEAARIDAAVGLAPVSHKVQNPGMMVPQSIRNEEEAFVYEYWDHVNVLELSMASWEQRWMNIVCPVVKLPENTSTIRWEVTVMEPALTDPMPAQTAPRIVSDYKEQHSASLHRRAIGFEIEGGFAATSAGQISYGLKVRQIMRSVVDTYYLCMMQTLLNSRIHYQRWLREYHYTGRTNMRNKIKDEIQYFCAIQKLRNGMQLLDHYWSQRAYEYNYVGNTYIMPFILCEYLKLIPAENTVYSQAGPQGPANLAVGAAGNDLDAFDSTSMRFVMSKNTVYFTRPIRYRSEQPVDPLKQRAQVGECYFMMFDAEAARDPGYISKSRSITHLYNQDRDCWFSISLRQAIEQCRLFNQAGDLVDVETLGNYSQGPGSFNSEAWKQVWTRIPVGTGTDDWANVLYFGNVRAKHIDANVENAVADTLLGVLARNHYDGNTSRVHGIYNDGISVMRHLESQPLTSGSLAAWGADASGRGMAGLVSWYGLVLFANRNGFGNVALGAKATAFVELVRNMVKTLQLVYSNGSKGGFSAFTDGANAGSAAEPQASSGLTSEADVVVFFNNCVWTDQVPVFTGKAGVAAESGEFVDAIIAQINGQQDNLYDANAVSALIKTPLEGRKGEAWLSNALNRKFIETVIWIGARVAKRIAPGGETPASKATLGQVITKLLDTFNVNVSAAIASVGVQDFGDLKKISKEIDTLSVAFNEPAEVVGLNKDPFVAYLFRELKKTAEDPSTYHHESGAETYGGAHGGHYISSKTKAAGEGLADLKIGKIGQGRLTFATGSDWNDAINKRAFISSSVGAPHQSLPIYNSHIDLNRQYAEFTQPSSSAVETQQRFGGDSSRIRLAPIGGLVLDADDLQLRGSTHPDERRMIHDGRKVIPHGGPAHLLPLFQGDFAYRYEAIHKERDTRHTPNQALRTAFLGVRFTRQAFDGMDANNVACPISFIVWKLHITHDTYCIIKVAPGRDTCAIFTGPSDFSVGYSAAIKMGKAHFHHWMTAQVVNFKGVMVIHNVMFAGYKGGNGDQFVKGTYTGGYGNGDIIVTAIPPTEAITTEVLDIRGSFENQRAMGYKAEGRDAELFCCFSTAVYYELVHGFTSKVPGSENPDMNISMSNCMQASIQLFNTVACPGHHAVFTNGAATQAIVQPNKGHLGYTYLGCAAGRNGQMVALARDPNSQQMTDSVAVF